VRLFLKTSYRKKNLTDSKLLNGSVKVVIKKENILWIIQVIFAYEYYKWNRITCKWSFHLIHFWFKPFSESIYRNIILLLKQIHIHKMALPYSPTGSYQPYRPRHTKRVLHFISNPFSLVTNVCVGIRKYIPVGHVCDQ